MNADKIDRGRNRKIHASNGNIDNPNRNTQNRWLLFKEDGEQFWHSTVIKNDPRMNAYELKQSAARHFPILYYCRQNSDSQAFTNAGTLHQFLTDSAELISDVHSLRLFLKKPPKFLKWIGLGVHQSKWRMNSLTNVRGLKLNPAVLPRIADAVGRMVHAEGDDYRSLALKIDLYDELRDSRFLQPSGVEYAWASPDEYSSEIITLNCTEDWNYEAIFISLKAYENSLASSRIIKVGSAEDVQFWKLNDVKVIGARADANPLELETWVIAHLKYPLAWVLDTYSMSVVGRSQSKDETFVRTAGLVDIHDDVKKIVFVIPDDVTSQIKLANDVFQVVQTYHPREDQVPVPIKPFDKTLEKMLLKMLKSPTSLRKAFSDYSKSYFIGDINWPEINSITVALTVRWHQRVETSLTCNDLGTKEKWSVGAPLYVLKKMKLVAHPSINKESYQVYGCSVAVNGLDQRFVGRKLARKSPAVSLGSWSNMAEVNVLSSFALYNTRCGTGHSEVQSRMHSGGQDRIARGRYLRRAFEAWKRAAAQTDHIAFPYADSNASKYWLKLIGENSGIGTEGSTCTWFARNFLSRDVLWSWDMNLDASSSGSTLTGVRTVSSWWRSVKNTEFSKLASGYATWPSRNVYSKGKDLHKWTYDKYFQLGKGKDAPELESALMRVDLERIAEMNWGLSYRTHPEIMEDHKLVWVVDSSYGGILAEKLGWIVEEMKSPKKDVWGWGLHIRIKDYSLEKVKTLVIPSEIMDSISESEFSGCTILYRGSRKQIVNHIEMRETM